MAVRPPREYTESAKTRGRGGIEEGEWGRREQRGKRLKYGLLRKLIWQIQSLRSYSKQNHLTNCLASVVEHV